MSEIISVKRTSTGSLQGELIAVVKTSTRINVLQQLNRGDDRFNPPTPPRHAWFPVTMESLRDLGVDSAILAAISNLAIGEKMELSIKNPEVGGESLEIQVNESVVPDKYQYENAKTAAKQLPITSKVASNRSLAKGRDLAPYIGEIGYFIAPTGEHIFVRTEVQVESQVKHTIIEDAVFVPAKLLSDYGATLAEPIKVEATQKTF